MTSALSEVDISNMALANLGISLGIQSFNDKTAEAKACAFWYPKVRTQILRAAPWNFAYTCQVMTSDGSNVPGTNYAYPGWRFAYQYPNDCLQAIAVTTIYGQRFGQNYLGAFWGFGWRYNMAGIPKIPFKIVQSTATKGQRAILTDLASPAYLWYVQDVTDSAMFDPLFSSAFSWLLAGYAGGTLKSSTDVIQRCNQEAKASCASALAQSMNEAQQDPAAESPSISVR